MSRIGLKVLRAINDGLTLHLSGIATYTHFEDYRALYKKQKSGIYYKIVLGTSPERRADSDGMSRTPYKEERLGIFDEDLAKAIAELLPVDSGETHARPTRKKIIKYKKVFKEAFPN